ncbi:MAG: hypothetical protein CML12_00640, partial [Puniceicoccaceae bacterium]|nr:hypothetical protein [Puniceicoccaceae bacterium]
MKTYFILIMSVMSALVGFSSASAQIMSEAFGGASAPDSSNIYNFPATADDWGGWKYDGTDVFPLEFGEGGSITVTASVPSGGTANLSFHLERQNFPNHVPEYEINNITVSGATSAEYTVAIPATSDAGGNLSRAASDTYSSVAVYIAERDIPVEITSVSWVTSDALEPENPVITDTSGFITTSGAQDYYLEITAGGTNQSTESGLWNMQIGEWYGGESGALMFFPVPNLGAVADPFTNAEFGVNLNNSGSSDFEGDLVLLGVDEDTDFNDPEHFDRAGGTVIMDGFLASNISQLPSIGSGGAPQVYTDSDANAALTAALNTAYDGGSAVGKYFVFRIMADQVPTSGSWQVLSGDAGGGVTEAPRLNWTTEGTDLPFLGSLAAQDLETVRSGGVITRKSVHFNFQNNPHPDTTPNFDSDSVSIDSFEEQPFTINIPAYNDESGTYQSNHQFNNWIFYVEGQGGQAVAINDLTMQIGSDTWGGNGNDSLIFEENFGGTRYVEIGDDNVYYFPSEGANLHSWGGFALLGYDGLYPLVFDNGATITFNAKLVDPASIPDPLEFNGEQAFADGSIDFSQDTESPYKWSAYIEWFALTDEGEQGAREEGQPQDVLEDLQVTPLWDEQGVLTLEPNSALYRPGSMWAGDNDDGTRYVINTLRIEGAAGTSELLGNSVTFTGTIDSFDIDPRYTVTAFIKLLDVDTGYGLLVSDSVEITQAGNFSLTLDMPEGNYAPQLGFDIAGINANPDTDWGQMKVSGLSGSYGSLNPIPNASFNDGDADSGSIDTWTRSTTNVSFISDDGVGLRSGSIALDNSASTNRLTEYATANDNNWLALADLELVDAQSIDVSYSMKRMSGNDLGLVQIAFADADGNAISYVPDVTEYSNTLSGEEGAWGQYTQTIEVPATADRLAIYLISGAESVIRFDAITITETDLNSFSAWMAGYPNASSNANWDDDADGDGLSNGLEHVMGTDPSVRNSGMSNVTADGSSASFQHSHNENVDQNASTEYTWSSDLTNWHASDATNAEGTTVTITSAVTDGIADVNAAVSGTATSKLFIKLTATLSDSNSGGGDTGGGDTGGGDNGGGDTGPFAAPSSAPTPSLD